MQEMPGNVKLSNMDSVKDGMQVRLENQEAGLPMAWSASLRSISYSQWEDSHDCSGMWWDKFSSYTTVTTVAWENKGLGGGVLRSFKLVTFGDHFGICWKVWKSNILPLFPSANTCTCTSTHTRNTVQIILLCDTLILNAQSSWLFYLELPAQNVHFFLKFKTVWLYFSM